MTTWDPAQYNRFADERELPFWDLAGLLEVVDGPRLVDLGCGDGRLTAQLAKRVGAADACGVDSSTEMLRQAEDRSESGVRFEMADIATWTGERLDIVFTNAALHWVPDHRAVLRRLAGSLAPGGQLAVQVPANDDHPSHVVSRTLAAEWLGEEAPPDPVTANVLAPTDYAELLHDLGFDRRRVRLEVYGHLLADSGDVAEWVKGSSLTRFKKVLSEEEFDRFYAEYRRRLIGVLGERSPYLYTFKRIFLWGRLAS